MLFNLRGKLHGPCIVDIFGMPSLRLSAVCAFQQSWFCQFRILSCMCAQPGIKTEKMKMRGKWHERLYFYPSSIFINSSFMVTLQKQSYRKAKFSRQHATPHSLHQFIHVISAKPFTLSFKKPECMLLTLWESLYKVSPHILASNTHM